MTKHVTPKISRYIICLLFTTSLTSSYSQAVTSDSTRKSGAVEMELGVSSVITSNGQVPYWMRANQFGNIPLEGLSIAPTARIVKHFSDKNRKKLVDWGAGMDLRLNIGKKVDLVPVELYAEGKLSIFHLKVGRSKDMYGLVDTTLSTGSYAVSGNSLGIPKIELSVPEFLTIPFLKFLAFKGSFSHGWMGKVPIQYGALDGSSATSYFHNLSFYGRLGKSNWPIAFLGGVNHEVIWGNDKLIYGDQYNLSTLDAFWHVISGKKYTKHGLKRDISKIGNHLGSIDVGLEIKAKDVNFLLYRQQFYDKGALAYLANIEDGLTGISIKNTRKKSSGLSWTKFLVEMFYSKGQAGKANAKKTPSGAEYYYNHAVYAQGYSYQGLGIGNPLITSVDMARDGLPNSPLNYFINNRVSAFHLGVEGTLRELSYQIKFTYSDNFGEYRTSNTPYWYNGHRYDRNPEFGIFPNVKQFSAFAKVNQPLKNNTYIELAIATDQGKLLYNSFGAAVKLAKKW